MNEDRLAELEQYAQAVKAKSAYSVDEPRLADAILELVAELRASLDRERGEDA